MDSPNSDTLTNLQWLAGFVGFVLAGGLLGYLKFWREGPKERQAVELAGAQTAQARALTEQTNVRTVLESMKFNMDELRADVERLRDDRNSWRSESEAWQARSEAAEKQLEIIKAERTLARLTDHQ